MHMVKITRNMRDGGQSVTMRLPRLPIRRRLSGRVKTMIVENLISCERVRASMKMKFNTKLPTARRIETLTAGCVCVFFPIGLQHRSKHR